MSHKDRTYILSFDRLVHFLYKYFLQPAIGVSFFSHNELISKTSWKLLYCLLPRLLKWLFLPGMSSITFNTHFILPIPISYSLQSPKDLIYITVFKKPLNLASLLLQLNFTFCLLVPLSIYTIALT